MQRAEQVDVWLAASSLGTQPEIAAATTLSRTERSRAATMDPSWAAGFVTGRLLLRAALADHLGCHPREVALDATCSCGAQHGPVQVVPPGPWVSVSRHGPLVGIALRVAGPVGLDLESIAAVGSAPLTNVLRVNDAGTATDVGIPHGGIALARAWVRAEATLKMLGVGLRRDPADVQIDSDGVAHLDGAPVARLLDLVDDVSWPGPNRRGDQSPGAVGALALGGVAATRRGAEVTVRIHDGERLLRSPSDSDQWRA